MREPKGFNYSDKSTAENTIEIDETLTEDASAATSSFMLEVLSNCSHETNKLG